MTVKTMLLLGQHYRFPAPNKISQFLQIHHLTLSEDRQRIARVALLLQQAEIHSKKDLTNAIERVKAPVKTFLPALIDCAGAQSIWAYEPSEKDKHLLRRMGWNS